MRISGGAFLIVSALALTSCETERKYALPEPPPLAEPAAHTPDPIQPTRIPPLYVPPSKPPTWTLMPSQRTSCGSGRLC